MTRYGVILASGIMLLVLTAGPPFIQLWMEGRLEASLGVLIILGIGCLIGSSLFVNDSFLAGTGHQRARAVFASIEGVLGFTLSILFGLKMGFIGVTIGFVIAVALIRGVICTGYVCRLLRISVLRYYVGCLLCPWTITGLLAVLAYYSGILEYVHNWPSLIVFGIVTRFLYAGCAYAIAMDRDEKVKMLGMMRKLSMRMLFVAGIKK
jgi:O-antigen/teichoic acid export membrane protein